MTPYGNKRRAGHYQGGTITKTTRQETHWDPEGGGTKAQDTPTPEPQPEPQAQPKPQPEPDTTEPTLKELQDKAEQLGLKTYGTKADIAQRIAKHQ